MMTSRDMLSLTTNRIRFNFLVHSINARYSRGVDKGLERIQQAVKFAVQNDTGYYCSPEIETKLCEIAQSIPNDNKKSPIQPGTILHIMTSAYKSGGHTRVVERWIANSPLEENHSVILINQEPGHFPCQIEGLVKARGGQVLQLPQVSQMKKAAILRSWSHNASKIILHVHMYDPVSILAYGISSFKVPVIFFNHADHLFWIGASIADLCVDMSKWRCDFSRRRRGINRTCLLPIPIDENFSTYSRKEAKKNLEILSEKKVIVTMAQEYKYGRYHDLDFFSFLLRITIKHPERIVLAIGPSYAHPLWEFMKTVSDGRVRACGEIPYDQIGTYLCAADLYIESFPFPSFTSLLDVANLGIPTLSLRLPLHHLDSVEESGTMCESMDDLSHRVESILNRDQLPTYLIDLITRYHRRERWLEQLKKVYAACPTSHQINDFSNASIDSSIGDLEAYLHYLKGNLRSDHVALLKRQGKLFFELIRLIVRFSLYNKPCLGILYQHAKKSGILFLSTIPKIAKIINKKWKKGLVPTQA